MFDSRSTAKKCILVLLRVRSRSTQRFWKSRYVGASPFSCMCSTSLLQQIVFGADSWFLALFAELQSMATVGCLLLS